jgi:hypothetical protein
MSTENNGNSDVSQIKSLNRLKIEKERLKERVYRELYATLLKKHSGVLATVGKEEAADFEEEKKILNTALRLEQKAIFAGFAVGVATFATLRVFPKYIIRKYGGEKKILALKEADENAKRSIHGVFREWFGVLAEGAFALWAGTRTYDAVSELSDDTYDLIAEVPLVAGRSIIAESLCTEWIDISHKKIPRTFWENVDAGTLKSQPTWRAIQKLCDSCVKREFYEKQIRKELQIPDNEPVSLPRRVPDNVLFAASAPLTSAGTKQLTSDK